MASTFGPVWISSYGKSDDGTWQKILSDLSDEQIACGVKALKHWQEKYPPNAIQFRKLCIEHWKIFSDKKKSYEKKSLAHVKINRDVHSAKIWISEIKNTIRNAKPNGQKTTQNQTNGLDLTDSNSGEQESVYEDLGYTR